MNTLERIKAYLEAKNIPTSTAEKACGFGNATLRNAFEGGKGIGSDKVEIFLSVYKDLSAEWLLRGTGTMIVSDSKATELEKRISSMSNSQERKEQAYDILLGMFDVMSKTYDYFGKEG